MEVKRITEMDREFAMQVDGRLTETAFRSRVYAGEGYVLWENGARVGLMEHCILWGKLPFLNLLHVTEPYRMRGFARAAVAAWEADMRAQGYRMALISTQADETAQHLYRKLGYVDCGGLGFCGTPLDQPLELFLRKVL